MSTSLVGATEGMSIGELMGFPECEFTNVSLTIKKGMPFERWLKLGEFLRAAGKGIQFWVGDWIRFGEHEYGEMYAQAIEITGKEAATLQNWVYVAQNVHSSRRRELDVVDFTTHAEVASLPPEQQEAVLAKAEKGDLTVTQVRREVKRIKQAGKPQPKDTEFVLSKESRIYLDGYMEGLALLAEAIPSGIPASDKAAIESMVYWQGSRALWEKNRTLETDFAAIVELFSFDEGTPGMEQAPKAHISSWLEKCGYFMSDSDLDERLDLMVEKKMLQVNSVEESRQDGRRGIMNDLYALTREFQMQMEKR